MVHTHPPNVWHGVIDPNGEPVSPVRMKEPTVPNEVLEGIEDIANGNTASHDELKEALNYE